MKITSVLYVDGVEPGLDFWVKRMGFEKVVEVPHGNTIGFVILVKDGAEVMLQSWDSVKEDDPRFLEGPSGRSSALHIDVDDWEDTKQRLAGADVVVPERTTFYGMQEIWVRTPGGHLVGFASRTK